MNVITRNAVTGAPNVFPKVGYQNLFRDGTVTASSEATSGPVENAYDGFTYDFWTSTGGAEEWIRVQNASPQPADYMAIAAHTLTGCSITPQRSTDGSSWTSLGSAHVVVDESPIVFEFDSVTDTYFRLLIEGATGAVSIGAIHVGVSLEMDRGLPIGWQPPSLNEELTYTNSMSEGGQILGRNLVSRGVRVQVESQPVTWQFSRDDWLSFIESANDYACFFWWAYEDFGEVVYGGMTDHEASFTHSNFLRVSFRLAGINR